KMHEAGWVRIEQIVQENLPDKKVYHLTEKGREALQGWLATPQALAQSHEAWLGQIFFGAELRKEQFKQVLEQRAIELQQMIQHFEQEVPGRAQVYAEAFQAQFDLPYWLLTLDFGLQKLRFELHWIQATQATLDLSSEKENEAGE
ncbi:MAG: PadR family transcriptional regulator, partial [Ktedonobacteraceae bacterium]|nr:PadR family transcriptional regulator [Ktedonobacteraceae bacterium]